MSPPAAPPTTAPVAAPARVATSHPVSRRREDELRTHLEQVVSELMTATGRQVEVEIDLPKPQFVDAGRIGHLVSNLLGNALSHGVEDKPVGMLAQIDGADLVISVSNSGDPIPSETVERLFQPFFRGGHAAGRHEQGLGLGLHIACEIAKAQGGSLTVFSSVETTTFEFRMPTSDDLLS
jgi:sigma-B regulation protein RsbU (phosphoserine phosphatase)